MHPASTSEPSAADLGRKTTGGFDTRISKANSGLRWPTMRSRAQIFTRKIVDHADQQSAQCFDFLIRKIAGCLRLHVRRYGEQDALQGFGVGSKKNQYLAAIATIHPPLNQRGPLHSTKRYSGRRIAHRQSPAQFPLTDSIFVPKLAEKGPLPGGYAVLASPLLAQHRKGPED